MVIKKITSIILAASTFATFALAGATVEKKNSKPRLGSNWAQAASAEARRTST